MKIGVTGTREGATIEQIDQVTEFLQLHQAEGNELHHGDCTGVDVEVAAIARELGYRIVCHPPVNAETRGFFGGDETRVPAGYLERDRAIVDATELLIVVPLQTEWQPKGGTWYTASYAKKKTKPYIIFYPDGRKESGL
jgi:hypothetical protein